MRLTKYEIETIRKVFLNVFEHGRLYLFGSRIDDTKKGGDIDIYIEPVDREKLLSKKINFLAQLKSYIGEQKIDIVIDRGEDRLIDILAKEKGVLLCKN